MQRINTQGGARRAGIVSFAMLLAACQAPPAAEAPDSAQALTALRSADSMVQAAIVALDAERTTSFYAEDAVLMPVAEPIVEGRAAILAEWRHNNGIPGITNQSRLVAAEVSIAGDFGYTRGTYESAMLGQDGQPLLEKGKWVSVWKRDGDGKWRITVDIYNTDTPPPIHAASTAAPDHP